VSPTATKFDGSHIALKAGEVEHLLENLVMDNKEHISPYAPDRRWCQRDRDRWGPGKSPLRASKKEKVAATVANKRRYTSGRLNVWPNGLGG
jgi:hypothetical protein